MGSHNVTCHPAAVTFPPLPQPKLVLDLATPEERKAELTYRWWLQFPRQFTGQRRSPSCVLVARSKGTFLYNVYWSQFVTNAKWQHVRS